MAIVEWWPLKIMASTLKKWNPKYLARTDVHETSFSHFQTSEAISDSAECN